MTGIADLLADRDRWTGAACVGNWALFDPRGDREGDETFTARTYRAQTICTTCQLIEHCHETAQNMRASHRTGMWAGIPYDHRGRPVKETS